ncbi:MAG: hypothetical protein HUU15_18715 [Candidatus Brocadiae bacterium]|nr:hypothetical protein [Candidatus Brocadiia bacterium]
MARWYCAKFLELTGIALCTSALYFGLVLNSMNMEVKLLSIGLLVFAFGWVLDAKGGAR